MSEQNPKLQSKELKNYECGCWEQLLDNDGCGTTAYSLCDQHRKLEDQSPGYRVSPGGKMDKVPDGSW